MIAATESDFARVAVRDDGSDDNGEPLCSEPAPFHPNAWSVAAPSFYDAIQSIVRSQHHLNTENI